MLREVRRFVLLGMIVCLPFVLLLTIWGFVADIFVFVGSPLANLIFGDSMDAAPEWGTLLISVVMAFLTFGLLGWLAAGSLGHWLLRRVERLFEGIPIFRALFPRLRHMRKALTDEFQPKFRHFVLARWNTDGWLPAFVTGETQWENGNGETVRYYVLFVPNSHVFTGGIRLLPADRVRFLDISVDEGITSLLTFGLTLGDLAVSQHVVDDPLSVVTQQFSGAEEPTTTAESAS